MKALKKGSFRLVHRNIWEALAKFGKGNHREAIVFLYLETGPHSNYTGLFQAPLIDIAKYTCLTIAEVLQAIDNLSRWGWIVYDKDRQMVFVKGMLFRQLGTTTPNEDNLKGVIFHVERMPEESPAVEAFISANREIPEIDELFKAMYGGVNPGGVSGGATEGLTKGTTPTRDLRLETLNSKLETSNEKQESVNAEKSLASTARVQPLSSTPESTSTPDGKTPVKGSPIGSPGKSTPGEAKSKGAGKGKPGNGHGLSDAGLKKKGLAIAKKKLASGEWDLGHVSEVLRREYGFTSADINTKVVSDALCLFPGEIKEATH
jgi:hypothetical protein